MTIAWLVPGRKASAQGLSKAATALALNGGGEGSAFAGRADAFATETESVSCELVRADVPQAAELRSLALHRVGRAREVTA